MQRFSGVELARRREAAGLTRAELARQTGRSDRTFALYETGRAFPSAGLIHLVTQALDCEPGDLFVEVDSPALEAMVRDTRRAQGLPDHVDEGAQEDVAELMRRGRKAARTRKAG